MDRQADKRDRDQRVQRTVGAIVDSFNEMVLSRPFDTIHVADIVGEAGIGRSTFYEHFRNTDELLKHAASGVLTTLADAIVEESEVGVRGSLFRAVEHFREHRGAVRSMLRGTAGEQISLRLAELIEKHLRAMCLDRGLLLIIPPRLAGAQIAEAQLRLVSAWLDANQPCPAESLAEALGRTSRGLVKCLIAGNAHEF